MGYWPPHPGQHWPEFATPQAGTLPSTAPGPAQPDFEPNDSCANTIQTAIPRWKRTYRPGEKEIYRRKKPMVLNDLVAPVSEMDCMLPDCVCESASVSSTLAFINFQTIASISVLLRAQHVWKRLVPQLFIEARGPTSWVTRQG